MPPLNKPQNEKLNSVINDFQTKFYDIRQTYDSESGTIRKELSTIKKELREAIIVGCKGKLDENDLAKINRYADLSNSLASVEAKCSTLLCSLLEKYEDDEKMMIHNTIRPFTFFGHPRALGIQNVLIEIFQIKIS